ncbi:hypothetical protein BH10PSE6_BH10PSE6_11990 [soil metagenome]
MAAGGDDGQAADDPRKRDFAIVVGIKRYPKLSRDGTVADLQGSETDAEKVRDWLVSVQGGGLPPQNIEFVVRPRNMPKDAPAPTRDAVVEAFVNMYARCWTDSGAPRIPTGRRLYVYVSGHGLANDLDHGALLCSNSSNNLYSTVAPYTAIKAFRQAGFFDQFVVWFDGCMDWAGIEGDVVNYSPRPGNNPNPPGPVFTAYAARPRLRAVEAPDGNGVVSGIFTRALLAGLEGEAVDSTTGEINGIGLQNHLFNAMPKYFPDAVKTNVLVDKQPSVRTDPGIIFATNKAATKTTAVLNFGAEHNGALARLWGQARGSLSLID